MQNAGKSRKALLIGIIAAIVVLAAVLGIVLTQCVGGQSTNPTGTTEDTSDVVPTYTLYWNADRALYDGKSEAGMSSRMPESDGYFHVRFVKDGEEMTLKVADRKLINSIDVKDIMGLEFDENGIVTNVIDLKDMPLEKAAWQFYVQSFGGKTLKANSSSSLNGMELLLEGDENTLIMDMSGKEGPLGTQVKPIAYDRIYAITNLAGDLTHVFIYERPNYMLTHEAECQHCGKVVTWYEWVKDKEIPLTTGHYQLQNNVTTAKQSNTEEDSKICLDLNGYRIDGGSGARVYAMFNVGSELAIMDTSEAKTGTIAAHGSNGEAGMCVWVRYGAFYLYDGIMDGSDASSKKNGTTVTLQKNTYMYMYGGEIIGGTSKYVYNEATKTYSNGMAGAMCLNTGSKFVMYDGVIRDGYAQGKITERNKDGSPKTYQRGAAGNIFMAGGSVMEMYGGEIRNGKATSTGGNIFMDGTAELTIDGGKIKGGQTMGKGKNGGNIYLGSKATIYMKSGTISGGITRNAGGNVYMNGTLVMTGGYIRDGVVRDFKTGEVKVDAASRNVFVVNGNFKYYGGKIYGGVQATDSSATDKNKCYVGLYTAAIIDGGENSKNNLTLSVGAGGPVQVKVGSLRDNAKIRVTATTGIFTNPTDEKNADNFFSDVEGADIHYYQGCIALGRMQCVCGSQTHFGACDGAEYLWAPHISATTLPNRDGYFFLTKDVTLTTSNYLRGESSIHTRLDLNGKSVLGPTGKNRTYSLFENMVTYDADGNTIPNVEGVEMKLTVTDSVGTGKITMREHADLDQGALLWGRHVDSEINIYGGTFDGTAATSVRHAGVVISTSGTLNIYGGHIIGGNSTSGGAVSVAKPGATLTMTGGTIEGGQAKNGGSVYVAEGAIFNLSGGTIEGGVANNGGSVYFDEDAIFNLSGGTIEGGVANNGGSVYVDEDAIFNLSGGTIKGGQAMNGGNIYLAKKAIMNMSGGTITGGRVDNSGIVMDGGLGGNIYQSQDGTFTMTGGVIEKGYVRGGTKGGGHGGNLGYYGHVELLGGTIRDGEAHAAGGNVATIASGATIVMDGVRLENGKAGGNGGNFGVHVRNTKGVEIKGDTVITGGSAANGGNLAFRAGTSSAVTLNAVISDITISDGTATSYGGNIYMYNNTEDANPFETNIVLKNVTLEGGSSGTQGGNIFFEGRGHLTVEDSTLTGGTARQGGNLFAYGKTAVLKNSLIEGGTAVKASDSANGGNIYLGNKCTMELIGTTVKDGLATVRETSVEKKYPTGGNIYMAGSAHLVLDENAVISGGKIDQKSANWCAGGNIYLVSGTVDINGGTITGGDVESKGSMQGNNIHILSNGTVNLNSGKIENTFDGNQSIYFEGGTLNINGGEIVSTSTGSRNIASKADVGGVVNLKGGEIYGANNTSGANIYIPSGFTVNVSGGTVRDGVSTSTSSGTAGGGNILVAKGGILNITDGTVSGGEAKYRGGNIALYQGGTVNISGGEVKDGVAPRGGNITMFTESEKADTFNGVVNISGGEIKDGVASVYAGNLLTIKGAEVNMTGGTISGGKNLQAGSNGGSIFIASGATFNMSSGTVKNGHTTNLGGNIYSNGTVNISGDAYITGGTTDRTGTSGYSANMGNINGTLNISGGVIDGDVGASNNGRIAMFVNLSGKVVINKGRNAGIYLSSATNDYPPAKITIDGTLEDGSYISLGCKLDTVITSNATTKDNLKYFDPMDDGKELVWVEVDKDLDDDGTSDLHKLAFGLTYCICGVDSDDPTKHLGTCGGELLTWLPWDKTDSLPTTTGNWYLTDDVTLKAEKTISTSEDINIDLNGYTVKTENNLRVLRIYNKDAATTVNIAITNTNKDKMGTIDHNCTASTVDGAIVWLTQDTHTFSLYGGVLDASGVTSNTNATAIKVSKGVVNIYGGSVIGGTTTVDTQNGAAIRVNSTATMNIHGGSVTGGKGANQGGTIANYGTLNITGGTVGGGQAKSGNAITVIRSADTDKATMNISGGEIIGSVRINNAVGSCDINLSGKVVLKDDVHGYGIFTSGTDKCALDVSGLTAGSEMIVRADGIFAEGANETIYGYFQPDESYSQIFLDGDKLFYGRESCLCGNLNGKCVEGACDGTVLRWHPWRTTDKLPNSSGNYYLTGKVTGTAITLPDNTELNLDLNGYTVTRSGRLYSMLNKKNIVLQITDNSAAQTGTLRAGGKAGDQGFIWVCGTNNKFNLIRGTIDGSGRTLTRNSGLTVCVNGGNTFNMYGGTVIGGTYSYEDTGSSTPFGGAALRSMGITNVYGGTIVGGTSTHFAGGVYVDGGTFTLAGGTIEGGKAANGGAVVVTKNTSNNTVGKFIFESGTITGGQATELGGNVYIDDGSFIMNGGTLTSGKGGTHGGNLHQAGGTVELLGGTIENGTVTSTAENSGGGNISANAESGTLTLNGVTVQKGTVSARGGNIYLHGNGIEMTVKGNTVITGGTANYGGNIALYAMDRTAGDFAVATMDGGKITAGTGRANAGSVFVGENYHFILNGGTVENGTAKGDGGNIYILNRDATTGKLTMNGGTLSGGEAGKDNTAGRNAGNIYIGGNGVFDFNDGTISGGTSNNIAGSIQVSGTMNMAKGTIKDGSCPGVGGNVYVSGTFVMADGTISGGEAGKGSTTSQKNGGNIYISDAGSFEMKKGTVSDGTSNNSGGNIHVAGTMTMTGGTVKDGTAKNTSSRNIAVQGGTLRMEGGEVKGDLTIVNSNATMDSKIILSGKPVISVGTYGLKVVKVGDTSKMPLISVDGSLSSGASIVISKEVNDGVIGDISAGGYAKYFSAQDEAKDVVKLDDGTLYLGKYGCVCGGISGTPCAAAGHPKVKWTAWTDASHTPASDKSKVTAYGNYYLTSSISTANGNQGYPKDGELNIDLNGYNIVSNSDRLFRMRNDSNSTPDYALTIGIKNSRSTGGVISDANNKGTHGGLVWITKASHVFNLYSGILEGTDMSFTENGGTVSLSGGTFNLYGGEIRGGITTLGGGAVRVGDGTTFNMYGGKISGGDAANGGNILVQNGGEANLVGGTVTGGNATTSGGNIMVEGTLNLKGTTVENGTAKSTGGNIMISSTGTMKMSEGLVTGGNAAGDTKKDHENIHCKFGTVELTGGQIDGWLFIQNFEASASTIKISGNPKVTGKEKNLVLGWSKDAADSFDPLYPVIELGKLTEGAEIGITSGGALFATGSSITQDTKTFFKSDASTKQIVHTEEGLELRAAGEIWYCVCGGKAVGVGDHKCVDVQWTETSTMPTTSGNYILTGNLDDPQKDYDATSKAITVSIDLNGNKITSGSLRAFRLVGGAVLNITDTKGGGQVIGHGGNSGNGQGGTIIMSTGGKLNIFAGTITTTNTNNTPTGGGVIYTTGEGTTVNMYGGTVTGGNVAGVGGNVMMKDKSVFNLYGGEVTGGKTDKTGGNFHLEGGSILNVRGGDITGGDATGMGGNVYLTGSGTAINIYSGNITGGVTDASGGNVALEKTTTFYMEGGKISGGTSSNAKHYNVHCKFGAVEITGGTVAGGLMIQNYNTSASTVKISGNPVIYDENAAINLELTWSGTGTANYPVIALGKLTNGANIYVSSLSAGRVIARPVADYTISNTDAGYITPDNDSLKVVLEGGELKIAAK